MSEKQNTPAAHLAPEPKKVGLWARLKDRSKAPRKWWWPLPTVLDLDEETKTTQHEETSKTVRKTMFAVLVYCLFCLLTLAQPDASLLKDEVRIPFAETPVDALGFFVIGPLVLVGLCIYLHVFVGYWHDLGGPSGLGVPVLFNMPNKVPRLLAGFLIYWLPPIVLFAFSMKVIGYHFLAFLWFYTALLVFAALVVLQARRCPGDRRRLRIPVLSVILILIVAKAFVPVGVGAPGTGGLELTRADLSGSKLRGTWLHKASMVWADLTSADLRDAVLTNAILIGADLSEADLRGANLRWANLRGADLSEANLRGADLSEADLTNADLTNADLTKAYLTEADLSTADLSEANLSRAFLGGANLNLAYLIGADLSGAYLRGADLSRAFLGGADLIEADLRGANLRGADLSEANLRGAYLSGAVLGRAKNLTRSRSTGPGATRKPGFRRAWYGLSTGTNE